MKIQPTPIVPAKRNRASNGSEGAFDGSKWNLYLEWRLLHRFDLTQRGSALLDAIARMLLGYKRSRGEIGRRLLMEMSGIGDARDFNRVRNELERVGLEVKHDGRGSATRTVYDLGPMLSEALADREQRETASRLTPLRSTALRPSKTTALQPSISTAQEPPRIETTSSSKEVLYENLSDGSLVEIGAIEDGEFQDVAALGGRDDVSLETKPYVALTTPRDVDREDPFSLPWALDSLTKGWR